MSMEINGLQEVLSSIAELGDEDKLIAAMGKACALVERAAKEKAPKDSGELRRSITSKVNTDSGEITGVVFTPLEYAPYIEFGTGLFAESGGRNDVPWNYQDDEGNWHSTSGMKPHPFLRPALNENVQQIKRILKGGVSND